MAKNTVDIGRYTGYDLLIDQDDRSEGYDEAKEINEEVDRFQNLLTELTKTLKEEPELNSLSEEGKQTLLDIIKKQIKSTIENGTGQSKIDDEPQSDRFSSFNHGPVRDGQEDTNNDPRKKAHSTYDFKTIVNIPTGNGTEMPNTGNVEEDIKALYDQVK